MPAVNWGIFVAVVALVVGFGSSTRLAVGLRHRGDRDAGDRHDPVLRRRPVALEQAALARDRGRGGLPARRSRVLLGQPAQDRSTAAGSRSRSRASSSSSSRPGSADARSSRATGPRRRARCASSSTNPRPRPPSTASPDAVFLNANKETTPLAMRANVEHNNALHENVVIISIETLNVPNVPEERAGDDRRPRLPRRRHQHVTARFGFQDEIDVPRPCARPPSGSRATATSTTRPTSSRA